MSYKNIYYNKSKNKIHLWSDLGYYEFPYLKYGYKTTNDNTNIKTIFGENVKRYDITNLPEYAQQKYLEYDVKPEIRTIVDNFIDTDEVSTTNITMNVDIEVEKSKKYGYCKPHEAFNRIISITTHIWETDEWKVWVLDESDRYKNVNNYDFVEKFKDEISMMKSFMKYYIKAKPSIITGWNISLYDIPYIYFRLKNIFSDGKEKFLSPIKIAYEREGKFGDYSVVIAGVSQLDLLQIYKNYCPKNRPSYKLDYIAWIELEESKVPYDGTLQDLYDFDLDEFIRYNLEDVNLVSKIEKKLKYIKSHLKLCHYAHVPYEMGVHSTLLHEGNILKISKKKNLVWFNRPDASKIGKIVGAYVKDSKAGRFDMTFDQDLTSLYPMTIVTCNISPETKYAKIRDYITVWEDKGKKAQKGKTKFKINKPIFNHREIEPDYNKIIDIKIDIINSGTSYDIRTMGQLYEFLKEHNCAISANGILYKKDKVGILPEIILDIFKDRKKYKSLRDEYKKKGDKDLTDYYDQEQWKYKIVMNSLYGVLLQKSFRLFDVDNGQSITLTGRYCNMSGMDETWRLFSKIKNKAEKKYGTITDTKLNDLFDDPIITGDTDSIILTSEPFLYAKYGNDWKNLPMNKKVEETIGLSVYLAEKINKRMDIFSNKWLNSDKNYLSFKQEWVAESGFFVGVKKRYANKIIWQEGVDVDYLDIKGLDIIRSSFPKEFQDFMKGLLLKILDNEDKHKIFDYILTFKEEIHKKAKEDIMAIAVVSSSNNSEKYIDDEYDFKKGTPWHMRGIANYNSFLDFNNYKNYIKISDSDKVGVVYLKNNRYEFEQMSFPLDTEVPDDLWDFVSETVDSKKSVSKLIDKKLERYYDVMGWEEPKRKEEKISSFFQIQEIN